MRHQTPYNSLRVLSRQVAVGNRRPLSSPAVNGRDTVLVGLLHAWIMCPSMFPTRASYMCVCVRVCMHAALVTCAKRATSWRQAVVLHERGGKNGIISYLCVDA